MRVEFEVHTSHTKESFRILARMIYGAKAGWLRVLIFVLAIVIIAFGVIAMVQTGFSLSPLIVRPPSSQCAHGRKALSGHGKKHRWNGGQPSLPL